MSERNETSRDDGERTIDEKVRDHADILEKTFGMAPDTARMNAEDKIASGMRKPASDDVESERIAAAKAEERST